MNIQWIGHNGKGRGSRIIKFLTRGKYSHISVRVIDMPQWLIDWALSNYGYTLTSDHEFESIQGAGVRHQPFVPSDNQAWYELKTNHIYSELEIGIFVKEACKLVGCKYDWRGIGGFVTRRNVQNPFKWFCSEFACHLCEKIGITVMNMPHHWITPNVGSASPIWVCIKEATS